MSEQEMPAAEAASYELAFHVLPTVAEGEVATVFDSIKSIITTAGGAITDEEAPDRFELAYEIVKYLEGRNRKFTSAYFGWVRFTIQPAQLAAVSESVDETKELLRHLLIRLTKVEEAEPFYFHEALAAQKQVDTIDTEAPAESKADEKTEAKEAKPADATDGEAAPEKVE